MRQASSDLAIPTIDRRSLTRPETQLIALETYRRDDGSQDIGVYGNGSSSYLIVGTIASVPVKPVLAAKSGSALWNRPAFSVLCANLR